jgi:ribonuclease R
MSKKKSKFHIPRRKPSSDKESNLKTGTISVHAVKGFGFVKVEGMDKDIFIPKHLIHDAVNGDTVEVEITDITAKGPEGRVVAVLERSHTHLGCTIIERQGSRYIAYAPLLGSQKAVFVQAPKTRLKNGDRIICEVLDWKGEEGGIDARMTRRIGHISDTSCDIAAAIEEFELPHEFTKEAIQEAKSFKKRVNASKRVDLTKLECVTIDPDTAKDYDDAISVNKDENGHYRLGVHIADAAAYVKCGSHLDRNAYLHCNSTYFPGCCLPMLPPELSNELCSLKPNVKRLTISVMAEFDANGTLIDYQIFRSCIKSRKRLTYKEALAIIQAEKKHPLLPLLDRMIELCSLLKQKRFGRGSIDFALAEGVVIVNQKGEPQRIERVEYDITHQMIEEFMLKANEIVAIHLNKMGKELIYRIHDEPSAETFEDFYNYARALGFTLPPKPTHHDIQKLFEQAKDSALASQLSVSFIRSMKLAFYSPDNIGHYGLALEHYCHFTSPIRRYTDLIIQRLLFNEEDTNANLAEIAEVCSQKERLSCRAESSVVLLKKLRLAAMHFENDPSQEYSAAVTRIKPFALFFEVPQFDLEGSIHVSELGNDYFEYDAKRLAFRGRRTGKNFNCGDILFVRIREIDLVRQQARWEITPKITKKMK